MCETPKSPPGDYNSSGMWMVTMVAPLSVKHLNPRQGITTTDRGRAGCGCSLPWCVKHLNPRQGITTVQQPQDRRTDGPSFECVKHLNPRQGITTRRSRTNCFCRDTHRSCETPKSPPGDYNTNSSAFCNCSSVIWCETPKSPPGDYNSSLSRFSLCGAPFLQCETPKSPPGDYNSQCDAAPTATAPIGV